MSVFLKRDLPSTDALLDMGADLRDTQAPLDPGAQNVQNLVKQNKWFEREKKEAILVK